MSCKPKPLKVAQGTTENIVYRPSTEVLVYKAITAKVTDTPLSLTVTGHGAPDGWNVAFAEVGYDDLKPGQWPPEDDDFHQATATDADTLTFNGIDLGRFEGTWANGHIVYETPLTLSSASAVLNVYDSDGSVLAAFDADLNNTTKTLTVPIDLSNPTTLEDGQYTFALLFTDSLGEVTVLDEGEFIVYQPGSP